MIINSGTIQAAFQASLRDAILNVDADFRGLKPHGYHQTSLRDEYRLPFPIRVHTAHRGGIRG